MSKSKRWKVWVLVGADGYVYATTCMYTRKECLSIAHQCGVKAKRATLTLDSPKRAKPTKEARRDR